MLLVVASMLKWGSVRGVRGAMGLRWEGGGLHFGL